MPGFEAVFAIAGRKKDMLKDMLDTYKNEENPEYIIFRRKQ